MEVIPIKTSIVHPFDDLFAFLDLYLTNFDENQVLVVTSKIIALTEGAVVSKEGFTGTIHDLVASEAELYLSPHSSKYNLMLTIKHNVLAVNAGIDQSNAGENFVLLPKDPFYSAAQIWNYLKKRFSIKKCGVVITDSKSYPLRWGRIGTCLGHCGFEALSDKIGHPDLFGKPLSMTKVDIAEGVAMAAVLEMGEADEAQPMALVKNISQITFIDRPPSEAEIQALRIDIEDDVFAPLLMNVKWQKNQKK